MGAFGIVEGGGKGTRWKDPSPSNLVTLIS